MTPLQNGAAGGATWFNVQSMGNGLPFGLPAQASWQRFTCQELCSAWRWQPARWAVMISLTWMCFVASLLSEDGEGTGYLEIIVSPLGWVSAVGLVHAAVSALRTGAKSFGTMTKCPIK